MFLRKTMIGAALVALGLVAGRLGWSAGDATSVQAQGYPSVRVDLGPLGCVECAGTNTAPGVLPPIDGVIHLDPARIPPGTCYSLFVALSNPCGILGEGTCGMATGLYRGTSQYGPWSKIGELVEPLEYHHLMPAWYRFRAANFRSMDLTSGPSSCSQ